MRRFKDVLDQAKGGKKKAIQLKPELLLLLRKYVVKLAGLVPVSSIKLAKYDLF